jgi:hypothetical protein
MPVLLAGRAGLRSARVILPGATTGCFPLNGVDLGKNHAIEILEHLVAWNAHTCLLHGTFPLKCWLKKGISA